LGDEEDEVQAKPKKEEDVHAKPARPRGRPPKASKAVQDENSQRRTSLTMKQEQHQQQRRVRRRMLDECADDVRTEH